MWNVLNHYIGEEFKHSQVLGKDVASKNNELTPHIGLGFKSGEKVAKVVLKYVMVRPVIAKVICRDSILDCNMMNPVYGFVAVEG